MDKKHVLIVDDELQVARALRSALGSRLGAQCEVQIHTNPDEALELLKMQPFDLLVTDLRMPGISGLELLREAHQRNPGMHSILITAFGSPDIEQQAHDLQAEYIPKPFNLQDFVVMARQLLEKNEPRVAILINSDTDVIDARQKVRELARTLGLNVTDQARISMATSTIAYALKMGAACIGRISIEWLVDTQGRGVRVVCTTTNGKQIELPPTALKDVAWMVDQLIVEPLPTRDTRVTMVKYV